jgi:glycosyltransferase involved in cell wall biosynthesis
MDAAPTVSVIIPVYNGAAFLAEAIESVLAQTLPPGEILVVDDGSTDDSAGAAARYAPRVQVIRRVNGGCGAARNSGVRLACGTLLAFLDADNVWVPEKLHHQTASLLQDDAQDAVFGRVEIFHGVGGDTPCCAAPELYDGVICDAMLIRRASFLRVGEFVEDGRIGEFVDWYARATECGLRFRILPDVVMKRRIHARNMTGAGADARAAYLDILRRTVHRRRAQATAGEPPPANR